MKKLVSHVCVSVLLLLLVELSLGARWPWPCGAPTHPVVLVPGIVGSALDAKLNRTTAAKWYCTKHSDWRIVFLSARETLSPACLCDELLVVYDPSSDSYKDQTGVQVRPHDFGGLSGVASLDPSQSLITATYRPLIKALEALGYKERETLWGAPYDWRLAGDGLEERGVAGDFKSLIEEAVASAGGAPAVIIAHSMGNLVMTHFMSLWGRAWVEKHIKHHFAISAPFGGAVDALKGPISGDNFDLHFPRTLLHPIQGISPSAAWLFPSQQLWNRDEVLVRTRSRNYTAHDLQGLLEDTGLKKLGVIYPHLESIRDHALTPGVISVPLTCAYGTGVKTDESYLYGVKELWAATAPAPNAKQSHDGDGTVNLRSLETCRSAGPKGQTAEVVVQNGTHLGVITAKSVLKALRSVLDMASASCTTAMEAAAGLSVKGAVTESSSAVSHFLSWSDNHLLHGRLHVNQL